MIFMIIIVLLTMALGVAEVKQLMDEGLFLKVKRFGNFFEIFSIFGHFILLKNFPSKSASIVSAFSQSLGDMIHLKLQSTFL